MMSEWHAAPRARPLMIYDGNCVFCRRWIGRWGRLTGNTVEYAPSQAVGPDFSGIPAAAFTESVVLVEPDGEVYTGAQAVFRSLAHRPGWRWPLWLYRRVPGVAPLGEAAYRWVARNRGGLGKGPPRCRRGS